MRVALLAALVGVRLVSGLATVAGLAVRRVLPLDDGSPWIYEADLLASSSASPALGSHDALASTFWPASAPLARLLQKMPGIEGSLVLELGCGTGLCSLVAASQGAAEVLATDIEPVALRLTEAAREAQLLAFPGLSALRTASFDMFSDDTLPASDVMIVSDLFVTSLNCIVYASHQRSLRTWHQTSRCHRSTSPPITSQS